VDKLIIEAAINEQSSKDDNPHVPYSAEECAADALRCAAAGASIVHFHARDPRSGALLSPGTETYATAMRLIRGERPDLLVYPTYTMDDAFAHVEALAADPTVQLRCATIDPGAMNFSRFDAETRQIMGDKPFVVTHADSARFFEICKRFGLLYSVVVREPGHVRTTVAYHRSAMISGKILFKLNLADDMLFGLPPSPEAVACYMALVPADIPSTWMAYTYGPSHWAMNRHAVRVGAHVRTGLGDHPVEDDGSTPTNEELVRRVVELAAEAGRPVATPAETSMMLGSAS
jgi:3-keto-5-aminohexanoate cleavage enzyme